MVGCTQKKKGKKNKRLFGIEFASAKKEANSVKYLCTQRHSDAVDFHYLAQIEGKSLKILMKKVFSFVSRCHHHQPSSLAPAQLDI